METLKDRKSIIILILLLLGIAVSVYLVQTRQIVKSRAGSAVGDGLRVSNEDGKEVIYEGNNTWKTNSTHNEINIEDLQQLQTR